MIACTDRTGSMQLVQILVRSDEVIYDTVIQGDSIKMCKSFNKVNQTKSLKEIKVIFYIIISFITNIYVHIPYNCDFYRIFNLQFVDTGF